MTSAMGIQTEIRNQVGRVYGGSGYQFCVDDILSDDRIELPDGVGSRRVEEALIAWVTSNAGYGGGFRLAMVESPEAGDLGYTFMTYEGTPPPRIQKLIADRIRRENENMLESASFCPSSEVLSDETIHEQLTCYAEAHASEWAAAEDLLGKTFEVEVLDVKNDDPSYEDTEDMRDFLVRCNGVVYVMTRIHW